MSLLAGKIYDPAILVQKSTASLLAMTAFDTTNLRLTFVAPSSGKVAVRLRVGISGATSSAGILLGVLDGATVKLRMVPMGSNLGHTTDIAEQEILGVVTGLVGGTTYNWDAAYSVDTVQASTNINYGGPNDATGADAYGGVVFEVWDATNMLAGVTYDPGSAASKSVASLLAMTALDTTNLRLTFTTPASGNVYWRIHTTYTGASTAAALLLGILESTTVIARVPPLVGLAVSGAASEKMAIEASGVVTGLGAGSHTWDAAYAVQTVAAAGGVLKWGGPDDTTTNNAWGGTLFSVWTA